MKLTIRWVNREPWLASMRKLGGESSLVKLEEAVGRAAIRTQKVMRDQLERMVYSQPPAASGYVRTRALMRSVHAVVPGANHGGDGSRAAGGGDLAATSPNDVIARRGTQIISEVGSWISYAEFVHEGVNQPSSRPFVTASVSDAEQALQEEVERAIREMANVR